MNYNDECVFRAENQKDLLRKVETGFVKIPIYYGIDDDDTILIDTDSMMEEFQRTVMGIETIIDEIQET